MKETLRHRLKAIRREGLYRETISVLPRQGPIATVAGRDVLNLSSNDYLGLAAHPAVCAAAAQAALSSGAGARAARLVTGTLEVHERLEQALASFVGTERALLFGSGYLANVGSITALASEGGVIVSDEGNHASIVDACRLSSASVHVFKHRDPDHLTSVLRDASHPDSGPRLVVTESVFSMDGDSPPLSEVCDAALDHGAWVYVDEAHGFGVLGPGGRGLSADPSVASRVDVRMGTLGKALGSYGAFVAGSSELIEYLVNRSRTFLYSTALPPPAVAAALEALSIASGPEGDDLRARLLANASRLREGLASLGWRVTDTGGPIIPVHVGDPDRAMAISARLLDRGVLVRAMRWPTVAPGTERLRVVASAVLTDSHVDRALEAFGRPHP